MCGYAVMGVQQIQQGTQHTNLWGSCLKHYGHGSTFAHPHHPGSACEEAQNPLTEAGVQSQVDEHGQSMENNGVKCLAVINEQQSGIIPLLPIHMRQVVMEDVGDNIISSSVMTVGELERVQGAWELGANMISNDPLKDLNAIGL